MMHFVLDANTVIAEQFGASAHLSALLSASSAVGYKVYLPKTALEEIAAKYDRDVGHCAQEASKNLSSLSRLLGRPLYSPVGEFDSKEATKSFQDRLLTQLKAAESVILDYPSTPHDILVKRATLRKRPFDENGSGYRDALIWETVLELATQVEEPIVLVSKDKDFQDAAGKLHGDLIKDLESLKLPTDKVTLATNVADLVDQHVRPYLGIVPWESPLQVLAQSGVNLEDSIVLMLQDACSGKKWDHQELGIPWEYESPTLDVIESISGLTVVDIRQLPSSQILVKIEAKIHGEFEVFVYKSDWYILDDPRLTLIEPDWNDHYVWAEITLSLHCNLDLVIDTSNPEQQKVQDVSVEFQAIDC